MSATSGGVGLRSERGPVLLGVMLSTALVAIDATVIATAVPSVVAELGGFSQFPWLFSAYLLAQAVTVPVFGKLADVFGRKPVMLVGIGLFLVGSVLCGVAWSMESLIVFRAVQGLGAGAVQPMSMTIIGDVYSVAERAKVQGYVASVWGVSSVVGPTLGGVFSEYTSWRWIFLINIPLCLVAAAAIGWRFDEQRGRRTGQHGDEPGQKRRAPLDLLGASVLTLALTLLVLGVLEGGQAWPWASVPGVGVLAAGALLLGVFVLVERRAADPVVPLHLLRRRLIVTTSAASACIGAVLLALTSYVPTFVQVSLGAGPLVAGFALAALTIGWPISASQSGRVYLRVGMRTTAVIGAVVVLGGCALLLPLGSSSSVLAVAGASFVIGLGMGLTASPALIAAQTAVGWGERGVVTGLSMFARSAGSAVGIAVFGAVVNANLGGRSAEGAGVAPGELADAVHLVFLGVVALAVVLLVAVVLMPKDRPAPRSSSQSDPDASTVVA